MDFVRKIKSLLGFGPDTEDEPAIEQVEVPKVSAPSVSADDAHVTADPKMVHLIFDKVVEITNASMPQYLASSLNTERQRQYLYDALDESIKAYLAQLESAANDKCLALWQKERDSLRAEADKLKQRARELESKRSEIHEQKLSAERQKRALSERVHDLEAQVMQLEADKEQLELERHGLLNKVKVAEVHSSDAEQIRQQLQELQQAGAPKEMDEENAALKEQVQQLTKAVAELTDACEAAKVKDAMGTSMLNDLQSRAAESYNAAEEANQKIVEANVKIEQLNAQLASSQASVASLQAEISERDAQIEEYETAFEDVQAIADQISEFEGVRTTLENRVRELSEHLREARRENDTLRTTIKNNIYAHAQEQKSLRDQIDRLKAAMP